MRVLIPTLLLLMSVTASSIAESKNPDPDLAVLQEELKIRQQIYERFKALYQQGAISQSAIEQKEAQYKLFAEQVKHYQTLSGSAKQEYARLLKTQTNQDCSPQPTPASTPMPAQTPAPIIERQRSGQ